MGSRLLRISFAAKARAPFRYRDGEGDVERQRSQRDDGKPHIKAHSQNAQHQRHFNQRGQDGIQRIRDQGFGTAHAALDVAGHAARLALQVKAQAQRMQMLKRRQRNRARCPLRGFGKNQVPQLREHGGGKAQQSIGQQQPHGHHQCSTCIARLDIQRIHQMLEQNRHAHIGQLGADHEQQCGQRMPFVLPDIWKKTAQRGPVGLVGRYCGFFRGCR